MSVKSTVQQFTGNYRVISSIVPHINKIVKKKSEDELFESLIDDNKFELLMDEIYNKLPPHVKLKVKKDDLKPIISQTKDGLLKKKKYKKKLEEYKAKLEKRK